MSEKDYKENQEERESKAFVILSTLEDLIFSIIIFGGLCLFLMALPDIQSNYSV